VDVSAQVMKKDAAASRYVRWYAESCDLYRGTALNATGQQGDPLPALPVHQRCQMCLEIRATSETYIYLSSTPLEEQRSLEKNAGERMPVCCVACARTGTTLTVGPPRPCRDPKGRMRSRKTDQTPCFLGGTPAYRSHICHQTSVY